MESTDREHRQRAGKPVLRGFDLLIEEKERTPSRLRVLDSSHIWRL